MPRPDRHQRRVQLLKVLADKSLRSGLGRRDVPGRAFEPEMRQHPEAFSAIGAMAVAP